MDSFYCDFPQFIKLACADTYRLEFLVTANSGFISVGTFFFLIVSYFFILVTVHKHSSGGSSKALSTLSAHITVVVFFFGPYSSSTTAPYWEMFPNYVSVKFASTLLSETMDRANDSVVSEFVSLGLSKSWGIQLLPLFLC
ncbi:hypothetical protein HPG69_002056, partial [Diceros bicornis minor]